MLAILYNKIFIFLQKLESIKCNYFLTINGYALHLFGVKFFLNGFQPLLEISKLRLQ